MKLGDRIKEKRLELGLTQEQVAQKLYISRQTLSNWENSKTFPDIQNLVSLSDIYGISLDEFIKEDITLQKKIKIKDNLADTILYLGFITVPLGPAFLSGTLAALVSTAGLLCMFFSKDIAKQLKKYL